MLRWAASCLGAGLGGGGGVISSMDAFGVFSALAARDSHISLYIECERINETGHTRKWDIFKTIQNDIHNWSTEGNTSEAERDQQRTDIEIDTQTHRQTQTES